MSHRPLNILPVIAVGLALHVGASPCRAGIDFYGDNSAFLSRTGTLATQTFAGGHVPASGLAVEGSSLSSLTDDQVFRSGTILPGITFSTSNSNLGDDLELSGAGPSGAGGSGPGFANNVLHPAFYFSPLQISFSSGQTAVGLGLLSAFASGSGGDIVSVYSTTGSLLGTTIAAAPDFGAGTFLGIIATGGDSIGLITVASTLATGPPNLQYGEPGVDLVQFGPATPAPEPGSAFLVGIGLFGVVGRGIRRSLACRQRPRD